MAQKKLLFALKLLTLMPLLLCVDIAKANSGVSAIVSEGEGFDFKKQDLEFAKDITERSMQITLPEIRTKWLGLQNMLGEGCKEGEAKNSLGNEYLADFNKAIDWSTSFRIFVSSSMSKNLLKAYAKVARKYDAVLVLNGLPNGSWRKLSALITEISDNEPELIAMQIDDEAFARFNIKEVPSFVLSKEEDIFAENPKVTFDKVTGSIGIRKALEIFANSGQLKDIACNKLEQGLTK